MMTIQNWFLNDDSAVIVCDSLVSVIAPDGRNIPGHMVSKAYVVPHLSIILGVKEWMPPMFMLWEWLSLECKLTDWQGIVAASPAALRRAEEILPDAQHLRNTSRIVMFGYDQRSAKIRGALFEGKSAFAPQVFAPARILIPEIDLALHACNDEECVRIQQRADNRLPVEVRDNIGGPVSRIELSAPDGIPQITINRICNLA